MAYFTGKGYGVSELTDLSGRPLLTFQGPNDKKPILLSDRCAVMFDPTIKTMVKASDLQTSRLDPAISDRIKGIVGGVTDDELDHKIPLELGGSNMLANLEIQPGRTGGPSALSDTVETMLAQRVMDGVITLQFAWEAMANQKGFVLGEEAPGGVQFSFWGALTQITDMLMHTPSLVKSGAAGKIKAETQAQIDQNIAILKDNPINLKARVDFITASIAAVEQKSGATPEEAGITVKTMIQAYAGTSGMDKNDVITSLTAVEQRALHSDMEAPTILGVQSTTLVKVMTGATGVGAIAVLAGAVLLIIGTILVGPEAIAAAGVGFSFSSISTAFGLSAVLGTGVALVELGGMIAGLSFAIGFGVKEYYDNAVLAPTQQITALKDALAVEKTLGVGLQFAAATGKVVNSSNSSSSSSGGGGTGNKIFVGTITQGVLGSAAPFAPHEKDIIENADELITAAQNNLSAFLTALPGKIIYDLKLVSHVYAADGTVRFGATREVQKGTTKKGKPTYHKVTNKFAIADVYVTTDKNVRSRIAEIVLGPIDEVAYNPAPADLASLAAGLGSSLISTNIAHVESTATPTPAETAATTLMQSGAAPKVNLTTPTQAAPLTQQVINPGKFQATIYLPNPGQFFRGVGDYGTTLYQQVANRIYFYGLTDGSSPLFASDTERATFGNAGGQAAEAIKRLKTDLGIDWSALPEVNIGDIGAKRPPYDVYAPNANKPGINPYLWPGNLTDLISGKPPDGSAAAAGAGTPSSPATVPAAACAAGNLSDYYAALGKPLPTVAERATVYHNFGLGDQNLYTGTAVENAKLLLALKEQAGCQL